MENKTIRKKTVRSIIDELWEKNTVLDERKIRWFNGNLTDMLIQLYNYRINDLERLYITGALVERIRMTPHEEEISLPAFLFVLKQNICFSDIPPIEEHLFGSTNH